MADITITVSSGEKSAVMVLESTDVQKLIRKAPEPNTPEWDESLKEFGEVKSAIGTVVVDAIKRISG